MLPPKSFPLREDRHWGSLKICPFPALHFPHARFLAVILVAGAAATVSASAAADEATTAGATR